MSTEAGTETVDRQERQTGSLLAVARFEGERRLRNTGVLAVVFALFGAMFVALAPDIVSTGAYDDIIDTMPPAMVALVGFENFSSPRASSAASSTCSPG